MWASECATTTANATHHLQGVAGEEVEGWKRGPPKHTHKKTHTHTHTRRQTKTYTDTGTQIRAHTDCGVMVSEAWGLDLPAVVGTPRISGSLWRRPRFRLPQGTAFGGDRGLLLAGAFQAPDSEMRPQCFPDAAWQPALFESFGGPVAHLRSESDIDLAPPSENVDAPCPREQICRARSPANMLDVRSTRAIGVPRARKHENRQPVPKKEKPTHPSQQHRCRRECSRK